SNNVGVFYNSPVPNPDHITNADLNQLAFLGSETGNGLSQTLAAVYQTGHTYKLTVAVCGSYYRPLGADNSLELVFRYLDTGSNLVDIPLAVQSVAGFGIADTVLTDYAVSLPAVQSTAAWAGRPIDIELRAVGSAGGFWDLDNVRVVETPEPATLALLMPVGLLLMRRRRGR
ncbi:MAG: PEP-CTERM sorting domain-containing protein, partial [Phycisphaerae bacterium]